MEDDNIKKTCGVFDMAVSIVGKSQSTKKGTSVTSASSSREVPETFETRPTVLESPGGENTEGPEGHVHVKACAPTVPDSSHVFSQKQNTDMSLEKALEQELMIQHPDIVNAMRQQNEPDKPSVPDPPGTISTIVQQPLPLGEMTSASASTSATSEAKRHVRADLLNALRHPRALTTSLHEALDFVPDLLGKALQTLGVDMESDDDIISSLSCLASEMSLRTTCIAFAGIAAHDVSDRLVCQWLSLLLEKPVCPPVSVWHIEKDSACQTELQILHSYKYNPMIYATQEDEPCLFENIDEFWRPEIREIIDALKQKPWMALETLAPLLVERRAVRLTAHCKVHGRPCRLKSSSRHSCGSVCTPYSSQGLQQGLADVSVLYLLAWLLS